MTPVREPTPPVACLVLSNEEYEWTARQPSTASRFTGRKRISTSTAATTTTTAANCPVTKYATPASSPGPSTSAQRMTAEARVSFADQKSWGGWLAERRGNRGGSTANATARAPAATTAMNKPIIGGRTTGGAARSRTAARTATLRHNPTTNAACRIGMTRL